MMAWTVVHRLLVPRPSLGIIRHAGAVTCVVDAATAGPYRMGSMIQQEQYNRSALVMYCRDEPNHMSSAVRVAFTFHVSVPTVDATCTRCPWPHNCGNMCRASLG